MDHDTFSRMISDLQNLGALDDFPAHAPDQLPDSTLVELGADYLIASSPRRIPPASVRLRVLSRISSEPARVTTDPEGRITAINPAFSGLCGFAFSEVCGKKPGSFLQGEATDPAAVDVIRQAVRSGSPCVSELVNYHKDGTAYRVRIEIEPLRDPAGTLTGFRATETKLA